MEENGRVHTVPAKDGKGWWNKVDGQVMTRHRRKAEAEAAGRMIAKKLGVEHKIHRGDGVITESNSYGNDPYPPKG